MHFKHLAFFFFRAKLISLSSRYFNKYENKIFFYSILKGKEKKVNMFSILRNSGKTAYGQKDFIVDFESDVTSLPTNCVVGSLAFVIETSKYYMLNHSGQWIKVNIGQGNSTSGDGDGEDTPTVDELIYNGGVV